MAQKPRFRAVHSGALVWADFQGGSALNHVPSGKTHFLNEGTTLLLKRVLIEPGDAESAAARLALLQHARLEPRLVTHVEQLLLHLEGLGLVDRAPD